MSEAMAAVERAVRFGIKINKNEEDSNKRVTYLYDAAGMIPAVMDFVEGTFNYGSWGNVEFVKNNYPCMVKFDGTEDYRLNPDNYELKEDGAKSDITDIYYAGNAMSAFKGGWLCQYETATDEYIIWSNVKYDAAYNAYHRTGKDGTLNAGFYRHIYTPSLVGNAARSLSGCQTIGNMTAEQENEACKANGDKWAMSSWWEWNYIICLLKIMAKTEDLQEAYGNGNMSGYVNDSTKYYGVLASGSMDDKGQFYGYNAGNKQIKVFHTEAMWGDQWERICQMVCDKGVVKVQPYGDCNLTGAGFEKVLDFADYGVSGSVGGYMKDTVMTKAGRFPVTYTGSSSTYLCDYFWLNTGIVAVPLVGGNCNNGLNCGAYVNLNNTAGNANWNIAPGHSYQIMED